MAFFHKASPTLLLTDAVVMVPLEPPAVVQRKDLILAGRASHCVARLGPDDLELERQVLHLSR